MANYYNSDNSTNKGSCSYQQIKQFLEYPKYLMNNCAFINSGKGYGGLYGE